MYWLGLRFVRNGFTDPAKNQADCINEVEMQTLQFLTKIYENVHWMTKPLSAKSKVSQLTV